MLEETIWRAAELVAEWDDGYRYKLYLIPREVLDADSDEPDAHLLHGIDTGGVRRVDVMLDRAYGRMATVSDSAIDAASENAPTEAREILAQYL